MGKTAKCIEMLQKLSDKKQLKQTELAEELNVNVRNIYEYQKELRECGYQFEYSSGKYGGIRLKTSALLPCPSFSKEERDSLVFVSSYIANQGTIYCRDIYEKAMDRLFAEIDWGEDKRPTIKVTDRSNLTISNKELQERYEFFSRCIKERRVVQIIYMTTIQKGIKDEVEPYKLVMDDFLLLICYSRTQKMYQCIKLSNIQEYKTSDIGFSRDYFFSEDYLDTVNFNFLKQKYHHVELHLSPLCPYIGEKEFGENQTEEIQEDGSVILRFDSDNLTATLSSILSFEGECEVASPIILREKMMHIGRKIRRLNCKIQKQTVSRKSKEFIPDVEKTKPIVDESESQVESDEPIWLQMKEQLFQEITAECKCFDRISVAFIHETFRLGLSWAEELINRLVAEGYASPDPSSDKFDPKYLINKAKYQNGSEPSAKEPKATENVPEVRPEDERYCAIVAYCEDQSFVSIGLLQIHFSIGFPLAGKYVNQLIRDKYISPEKDKNGFKHSVNKENIMKLGFSSTEKEYLFKKYYRK